MTSHQTIRNCLQGVRREICQLFFLLAAFFCTTSLLMLVGATRAQAEIPPAPAGFKTPEETKQAIFSGKIKLAQFNLPVPSSVKVEKKIEYGKGGDVSLKLDLYSPKQISTAVPGVLFIHGGSWKGGSREIYHSYCVQFAKRGYVAATVSYRLVGVAPFPAAVEDVKCAIRWMRANAKRLGVDPDHLAAVGASAGGHLATMAAYSSDVAELEGNGGHADVSSRVQTVVDFYGPVDLTTDFARDKGPILAFMSGKRIDDARKQYELASPLTHVTADDPPTLVFHGTIDRVVPIHQSEMLVSRLKEVGVACEYDPIEGWPHAMDAAAGVNAHCVAKMFEFFDEHLPLPVEAVPAG